MTNPSGNYQASIISQYYCFGNECGGSSATLNWSCTDSTCDTVNITGSLPAPKMVPQLGSPTVQISTPMIPNSRNQWQLGSGTITDPSSICASGTLKSVDYQGMTFEMGPKGNPKLTNFCKGSSLSSELDAKSQRDHIVCHRIPYTPFIYCFNDNPNGHHSDNNRGCFFAI